MLLVYEPQPYIWNKRVMKMIKLISFTFIYFFLSGANAQSWINISGQYQHKKNFVYDSQSINVYPGLVTFNTRYDIPGSKLFFFHKLAYLCGSKEIHGIASAVEADKNSVPNLVSEVSDYGIAEHMIVPGLINPISKFCGTRVSRNNLEIPISASNDEITFMLPRETVISGFRVVIWQKKYSYTKEPIMLNGEEYKVNGEVIFNKKILRNIGYELFSWEYDCSAKSTAILSTVKYDVHGNVTSSTDFSNSKSFSKVVPGSVGQRNLEFACGLR